MVRARWVLPLSAGAVAAAGWVATAATLALWSSSPTLSPIGPNPALLVTTVLVSTMGIVIGASESLRTPNWQFAMLLASACAVWPISLWGAAAFHNPATTIAWFLLGGLAAPLVALGALITVSAGRRGIVAVGLPYLAAVLVTGLLPAFALDLNSHGCSLCADNPLAIVDSPDVADLLFQVSAAVAVLGSIIAVAVIVVAFSRASPIARRSRALTVASACGFLLVVAALDARTLFRATAAYDAFDAAAAAIQMACLFGISAGVVVGRVRARRGRSAAAALVVELAESTVSRDSNALVGAALNDDSVQIAFSTDMGWLSMDGVVLAADATAGWTSIIRDSTVSAAIRHRDLGPEGLRRIEQVMTGCWIAIENDRTRAQLQHRESQLRDARTRIVGASDVERHQLGRDLHDGAQQRLVGIAIALQMMAARLAAEGRESPPLRSAANAVSDAIAELRDIVHISHPAMLSEFGFSAAVRALAEGSRHLLLVDGAPLRRLPAAIEAAAFAVVATAASSGNAVVRAYDDAHMLIVEVDATVAPADLTDVEDRVGSVDGTVRVVSLPDGSAQVRAELPCPA